MIKEVALTYLPVESLIPYARNSRTHSPSQIAQIAASIIEFGWTNPILIDGEKGVIAGHGRLLAAKRLGVADVPVIELKNLSPAQKQAYIIADNQLALQAGWDEELLRQELADLQDADFDLELLGFSDDGLADLLAGLESTSEGEADDDTVPEPGGMVISQPGDIWLCGDHRVLCGDATDPACYQALLGTEKAGVVFIDPPYNVDYANTAKDKMRGTNRPILNDNLGEGFYDFLLAALKPTIEYCTGGIYITMSSSELDVLQAAFRDAGGHWSTFVIWAKSSFTLGRSDYQRQYEPMLYGWPEGAKRHWCGDRDQSDVWQIKKPHRNDLHPTMKPVELVERAIRNSSRPGDVVLDSFGGSGTTMVAAEKSGRHARLMELDPRYCDVIVRRWQAWTGKQAARQSDGVAFDDLGKDAVGA